MPGLPVTRLPDGADPFQMLRDKQADAVVLPHPPAGTLKPGSGIRRLFPDTERECFAYYKRNGYFPIMHLMAVQDAVAAELPPLKLDAARFQTALADAVPGPSGIDRVEFEVSTNPGAPFGPLIRIASGGELSRFILALKVALAEAGMAQTMIFDEIDRGVGGAVASAIGERLSRLARKSQLLVVTHSPQVAARAAHHYRIEKAHEDGVTRTFVRKLTPDERREEIARMLSGAAITDEARAQAARLLEAA